MRDLYLLLTSTTIGLEQFGDRAVPFDLDACTSLLLQVCILLLCVAITRPGGALDPGA